MIVPGHLFDVPGNHFRIGLGRRILGQSLGAWMLFWFVENARL